MNSAETTAPASWLLGGSLLAVSIFFFGFSGQIAARGVGNNSDPGPRLVPLFAATCLGVGSLWELTRALRSRSKSPSGQRPRGLPAAAGSWRDVSLLIVLLIVYVAALPWIGFLAATFGFAVVAMIRQDLRWWQAVGLAGLLVTVTYSLFVQLFAVPLPEGELWLGWLIL